MERIVRRESKRLERQAERRRASLQKHRTSYGRSDWAAAKARIRRRDRGCCQWCGTPTTAPPHHIVRVSQGGGNQDENLITLDSYCHALADEHRISAEELRDLLAERFGYVYDDEEPPA